MVVNSPGLIKAEKLTREVSKHDMVKGKKVDSWSGENTQTVIVMYNFNKLLAFSVMDRSSLLLGKLHTS